ncbi:MAG: Holliday junction branch migration protein RuvA [Lactobacillaceae bacterium]|jgi:Holliday junction DNA helicase RuvA|nr:Holliday junction branch migration protein RuvA [Lactobacillaceae bacterium]
MFDFLSGTIESIYSDSIALNVNGVGYKLYSATPYAFSDETTNIKFFIHQVVRENDISLYGFKNQKNRDLFIKLLTVNGVGPKSALSIIAYNDMQGLINAIENEDSNYLTRYPGIGPKASKMIIVSLKGKTSDLMQATSSVNQDNSQLAEALIALESLGFSKKDITSVEQYLSEFKDLKVEDYINRGLKLLVK